MNEDTVQASLESIEGKLAELRFDLARATRNGAGNPYEVANLLDLEALLEKASSEALKEMQLHVPADEKYDYLLIDAPIEQSHTPPPIGSYIVRLAMGRDTSEALLGDLEEDYAHDTEKYGVWFAKAIYLKACIACLWERTRAWLLKQVPAIGKYL